MKRFNKLFSVILCLTLCLSCFAVGVSAEQAKPNYLVIGDSIAKGFGLKNPADAAYGKIVADTNGYDYFNLGRTGWTSEDVLDCLENDENYQDWVEWADIISLSVGGNDFLLDKAVLLIFSALLGNYSRFDAISQQYYLNFSAAIEKIHELNPDAVILVQTLFNTWTTFTEKIYSQVADRVNANIESYLAENPDSYYIVDTREAFNGKPWLITTDTIHPNAQGNVLLAELTLQKLYEIGLGTQTEPLILVKGIDRDYLIEYFGTPLGQIITFLADLITGVRYH